MKKFLNIGLTLLLSLGFSACFTEDQMGLPDKVYFSNEGGEQVISANEILGYIEINTPKGDFSMKTEMLEDDTLVKQYEWITVTHKRFEKDFQIKVAPNTTGKKRKITIFPYSGPQFATIDVEQAK